MKIYGWIETLPNGQFEGNAITEDGRWICGHVMADREKIKHYLSVKKDAYDDACGEAWEYEFVPDYPVHIRLQAALSLFATQKAVKMGLRAACVSKTQGEV